MGNVGARFTGRRVQILKDDISDRCPVSGSGQDGFWNIMLGLLLSLFSLSCLLVGCSHLTTYLKTNPPKKHTHTTRDEMRVILLRLGQYSVISASATSTLILFILKVERSFNACWFVVVLSVPFFFFSCGMEEKLVAVR